MSESSKRQRSSLRNYVCVVFDSFRQKDDDERCRSHDFRLYILDCDFDSAASASSNEYRDTKPTFRLETDIPWVAFCGLDSTLYLFEGDTVPPTKSRARSVFKLEISGGGFITQSQIDLDKSILVSLEPMHRVKLVPTALPTPDGKSILVFSSVIDDSFAYLDSAIFELYDVASDSWKMLPEFPSINPCSPYTSIEAYGFMSESQFLVKVKQGYCCLDLNSKEWKEWSPLRNFPKQLNSYFITLDNCNFLFDVHCVYDCFYNNDRVTVHPLPLPTFPLRAEPVEFRHEFFPCIALLDDPVKDRFGQYHTCRVLAEKLPEKEAEDKCRVIMQLVSTDIETYKEVRSRMRFMEPKPEALQKGLRPLITKCKVLKHLVDVDFSCDVYLTRMSVFSISI